MTTTLQTLKRGQTAVVRHVHGGHGIRQQLNGRGVHPGDSIQVLRPGFFGGPVLVLIHGSELAIGQRQAQRIEVEIPDPP